MKLEITIKMDNAAFANGNMATEVQRITEKISNNLYHGELDGIILDINGNNVGKYEVIGD